MKAIDIGDLARQTGVSPSALRYYEEEGLISSVSRHGLRRQFGPEVHTQLALIALGKTAGFSLTEIKGMFGKNGQPDIPRDVLNAKVEQLEKRIRELTSLKRAIKHIAECSAVSHAECPKFNRMLRMNAYRVSTASKSRSGPL